MIRRVLCSATADKNAAISELLPPLTSSNEVDLQVYGIVAVIMREFVYAWYSKITPDHVFGDEIVKVIAHLTRGLEQRIRKVDLEALLFDELPELLEAHVTGKPENDLSYHVSRLEKMNLDAQRHGSPFCPFFMDVVHDIVDVLELLKTFTDLYHSIPSGPLSATPTSIRRRPSTDISLLVAKPGLIARSRPGRPIDRNHAEGE